MEGDFGKINLREEGVMKMMLGHDLTALYERRIATKQHCKELE